jgi:hypothetical protein
MTTEKKKNYVKNEPASIPRKKAKKFEASRDAWKEKNQEKQNSIKALNARMSETKTSRDNWKLESLKHENDAEFYKQRVHILEQELIKERIEKVSLLRELEEEKKKLRRSPMN